MNSETQLLVKMTWAETVCNVLLHHAGNQEAFVTLYWMKERTVEIVQQILAEGGKNAFGWARTADRAKTRLLTILDGEGDVDPADVNMAEEVVYNLAVITRMFEDMATAKKIAARFDIESLVISAYTVETLLHLPGKHYDIREDEIRELAFEFLGKFYKKLNEV